MPRKRSRISAGIVLGCVLAIACVSALGREALQEGVPRRAQFWESECTPVLWGMSWTLKSDYFKALTVGENVTTRYDVCAGSGVGINVTWTADFSINVTIGTTLLAHASSGNVFLSNDQLPTFGANVTLTNNHTAANTLDYYEIVLVNQTPEPQMMSSAPVQGGGVALCIAYATVIILGIASFKLPMKLRVLALLGNIIMPIVWFGGGAAANLTPALQFGFGPSVCFTGCTSFTVPENSGLAISAYIDFKYEDPLYMGFSFYLYQGDLANPIPVYYGEFGLYSAFTGPEYNSTFLPLPAGEYIIEFFERPSSSMEVSIQIPSAWSDIAPGTDMGNWRWAFLIIGICAAIVALVAVIKGKSQGKTKKIIPKPTFGSMENVVDVPFSAISSLTVAAPPGPVTVGAPSSWTCESCGKANEVTAKFCIGCGTARRAA